VRLTFYVQGGNYSNIWPPECLKGLIIFLYQYTSFFNTKVQEQIKVLKLLQHPVLITCFITEAELQQEIFRQ